MTNVIDLDSKRPHKVSEVVCLNCLHRWIAVRPIGTLLKTLQCPHKGCMGLTIETGEVIE